MYREVTMVEVKEVLRLWRAGVPRKRLAAQLGLDPKTVRRYLGAAATAGLRADGREVTDDEVREVLLALQPVGGRPPGRGVGAVCDAAAGDCALARRRPPADEDPEAPRPPGRRDHVRHALSLRGP